MLGTLYADCRTTLMPNMSCWHTASYPRGGAPMTVVYSTKVGYWNDSVWCNHTASNVSMGYNTPMSPPKADFLSGGNRFGQAYLLGLWESHVLVNDYLFLYPKSPWQLHGSGKKKKKKERKQHRLGDPPRNFILTRWIVSPSLQLHLLLKSLPWLPWQPRLGCGCSINTVE